MAAVSRDPQHQHNWPGTRPDLRLVPKGEAEREEELVTNRSLSDWHAAPIYTRASDRAAPSGPRLAPLRSRPVPVGGGVMRKLRLVLRDTWRFIAGPSALMHQTRRRVRR
jgi:hypothetical protein